MKNERRPLVSAIRALPAVGHLSVAAIYITMGLLTGLVCLGVRHSSPDLRTVMHAIKEQPLGPALLLALICCSVALAIWRGLQGFADLEEKGRKLPGLIQRGRLVASSIIYLGLSILAGRILLNQTVMSGEEFARDSASLMFRLSWGWFVIFAIGLICAGVALYYFYRALTGTFEQWFRCEEMTRLQKAWCFVMGRFGYAARGAILITIGYCLANAGWRARADEVTGQAGALDALLQQPQGKWIVAAVAIGLIANGIFALASARYGRIPAKKIEEVVEKAERERSLRALKD